MEVRRPEEALLKEHYQEIRNDMVSGGLDGVHVAILDVEDGVSSSEDEFVSHRSILYHSLHIHVV
jgi:hypothetical protein